MFTSKINLSNFVSDYKNKISLAYNQNKLAREEKYSQLLKVLASAGNDFDSAGNKELADQTSQILEILTSQIQSEKHIQNQKISSYFSVKEEDIIELD